MAAFSNTVEEVLVGEGTEIWDYVVVGLGGHGSATLAALSRVFEGTDKRVLGLEQFHAMHARGSSHGQSRIYRQAYFEHPSYVPLLQRSLTLWKSLNAAYLARGQEKGEDRVPLLELCGGLMLGRPDSIVVAGTLQSIAEHNLPHQILSPAEVASRYPGFNLSEDEIGVYEDSAGFLRPERCIQAHLEEAEQRGATIHYGEKMVGLKAVKLRWPDGRVEDALSLSTSLSVYLIRRLSLSLGAWVTQFPDLLSAQTLGMKKDFFAISKRLFWFPLSSQTETEREPDAQKWPVFIWDLGPESGNFYGFPALSSSDREREFRLHDREERPRGETEGGEREEKKWELKLAFHSRPQALSSSLSPSLSIFVSDPSLLSSTPEVVAAEREELLKLARHRLSLPSETERENHVETCMYTMTEDEHFVIDFHPSFDQRVVIASPCSGHGYKFCSGIGEVLAEMMVTGERRPDLSLFRLR